MIRALVFAIAGAMLLYAPAANAQLAITRLTLGGCSCDMLNTTVAEYTATSKVSATALTYTVSSVIALGSHTTSVYVRANSATMSNGKAVSECEWRRSDLATWNAVTTTNVLIESRVIGGIGASWNNSIFLRCSLGWVNDPPGVQAATLTFTLQNTP